ncbi:MAG: DUF4388 domain-containing protein [Acidobacteria bacterium]|nr:MAG: DUF4388 domain-containing protein [Acidobacteriota bacterium]
MSINGVLEDLPLADVLQFVHLGQRSGTLYLWRDDEQRAEISFHNGRIVGAWTPGQRRLGDELVAAGLLDPKGLAECLDYQRGAGAGRSIGQILIERGLARREDIHRAIKGQIQAAIFDLVTWRQGNFHFEVDELKTLDDFAVEPGELLEGLDLNTQMLLLEATRIFDEKQRAAAEAEANDLLARRLRRAGLSSGGEPVDEEADTRPLAVVADQEPGEAARCQVVSGDRELVQKLRAALPRELARVVAVRLREAGTRVPGETRPPLVVLDLRMAALDTASIASLTRTRPGAPVIALVNGSGDKASAYRAGAVAVLDPPFDTLAPLCHNLLRVLARPGGGAPPGAQRGGYSRFRRVVFDVQSGLLSETMALNLLNVISESVERAVLFLVQEPSLVAVGAFGFTGDGRPLAAATRGLRLIPDPACALRRAIDEGRPQESRFEEAALPAELSRLLGPPAADQVVIFPVLGTSRTISVIYTDNGQLEQTIEDVHILELATAQVGVAFEHELLRRQLGERPLDQVGEALDDGSGGA